MKIDVYNHKEKFLAWKETVKDGIPSMCKENSDLILRYIRDMEIGANVASGSVKGARSYNRLNSLRDKMYFFSRHFESKFGIKVLTDITESQIVNFFADMKSGVLARLDGQPYTSVDTYVRIFKAFWHWHQKINRKIGKEIPDITPDLDTKVEKKPDWVYLTEEQVKLLAESAKYKYKVLILFLYDSGIRSPTELVNVKVSDLYDTADCMELNVREEASKTFQRRIKLLICSDVLREYIKNLKLKPEDQLFDICPAAVNRQLKYLSSKLFGDSVSPAGEKYSNLSMYDFRHCSCCYWLPRYKSESALKYRFGWKKTEKIHYYSELLGMSDTIKQEDLLINTTKTEIEKRLEKSEKEKELLKERLQMMEMQMAKIMEMTTRLEIKVKNEN